MSDPAITVPKVLLFDVNETLLNLDLLEESVNKVLLENHGARLWFTAMLQYSLVLTVSGQFRPFPDIGAAVLQMMARNRNVILSDEDARQALEPLKKAPPHPDVPPALEALRNAGFRMAALTNSTCDGVRAQLDNAAIAGFFERQLSVWKRSRNTSRTRTSIGGRRNRCGFGRAIACWSPRTPGTSRARPGPACAQPS